jgi:hypothetical protein
MTVERMWGVALGTAIFLAASNVWTMRSATRQVTIISNPRPHTTTVIDNAERALPTREDDWAEPRVDLNGNEIDVAVSDYRVDRRGEMYERHAPDTALLHLSAPEL